MCNVRSDEGELENQEINFCWPKVAVYIIKSMSTVV